MLFGQIVHIIIVGVLGLKMFDNHWFIKHLSNKPEYATAFYKQAQKMQTANIYKQLYRETIPKWLIISEHGNAASEALSRRCDVGIQTVTPPPSSPPV